MRIRLVAMAIFAIIVGCDSSPKSGTSDQKNMAKSKGTIAISVLTMNNPFFKVIADTITEEAAKHGYDVIAVSGDNNVAKQQNQVDDFITRKVSAIVLCPCDSKAIGAVIKKANAAGIPVFTADIACLDDSAKVVSHIATDNFAGGKQAAEAMIEALGENGGKVVVIDYKQVESCIQRVKGFKDVLAKHNEGRTAGKISIVEELPGDGERDKGYRAAEDAVQSHPDLAGIFAINDPSALGARAALERANKTDQIKLIGFDGQPDGKQAIKDGKIYADPIQFPEKIGKKTMEAIFDHFEGKQVEKEYPIPTGLYRKADAMNDPSLK